MIIQKLSRFYIQRGYFVIQWIKKVLEIGETWKEAGAMVKRVTKEIKSTVETELRRRSSDYYTNQGIDKTRSWQSDSIYF